MRFDAPSTYFGPNHYLQGDRLQRNTVIMLPKMPEDDRQGPQHVKGAAQRMVVCG
jgi:hypothetical protein